MVSNCKKCNTPLAQGIVKCPKCGALYFENALLNAPKAPSGGASPTPTAASTAAPPAVPVAAHQPPAQPISTPASTQPPATAAPAPLFVAATKPAPVVSGVFQKQPPAQPPQDSDAGWGTFTPPPQDSNRRSGLREVDSGSGMLGSEVVQVIYTRLKSSIAVWTVLIVWTAVLSVASVFLVAKMHLNIHETVNLAVTDKFKDEKVKAVVETMAREKAQSIFEKQIAPGVEEFRKRMIDIDTYLAKSKIDIDQKYARLAEESSVLDERKTILNLAEQSLKGYRRYFEQLVLYAEREVPAGLSMAARQALEKVENAYRTSYSLDGVSVNYLSPEGKGLVNEKIPTPALLRELRESPSWKIRARTAELLGERMERELPEQLMVAAETDPHLAVVKYALLAFSKITGYSPEGVFAVKQARSWWEENRMDGRANT